MKGSRAILITSLAAITSLTAAITADAQVNFRKRLFPNSAERQTQPEDVPLKTPRLFWKNGEFLDGELVAADDHTLSFKSPVFDEPLQLHSSELARVEFPASPVDKAAPAFCLLLKNGDRLFAGIDSITQDAVTLSSERHGNLRLPLNAIQTITRLKGGSVLYQGPHGSEGWKHYGLRDAQGFPWSGGERGTMVTRMWNRSAMIELALPDKVQVDVVLSASEPVRFALCFGQASNSTQLMALETWQEDLVVAQQNKFVPVLKLGDTDRSLALRMLWDRAAKKLQVHDWAGAFLAEFQAQDVPTAGTKPFLVLRNKGADLTLEHLCVRAWDGGEIAKRDVKLAYLETLEGRRLEGSVLPGEDQKSLRVNDTVVTLDNLAAYDAGPADASKLNVLHTPLAQMLIQPPAANSSTRVRYSDGTVLTGNLVAMKDGVLTLREMQSGMSLEANFKGMSRLTLNETGQPSSPATPAAELDDMDTLRSGLLLLHGHLEGTGDSTLRWRAPGALAAVPVKRAPELEIHRPANPDQPVPAAQALFFLKDGNVFGAKLRDVSESGVKFASAIAEATELEPGQLHAIHFNNRQTEATGFSDNGWIKIKGSEDDVQRTGEEKMLLRGSGSFGHPSILAGDEVGFTLSMPNAFGALAVDLFTGDFDNYTKGAQLHLIFSGNEFWTVLEAGDNNSRSSEQMRNLNTRAIDVRLMFSEGNMHVFANGIPLMNAALDASVRKGSGLIFSPSLMWGSPARDVEISNFYVKSRPDFVQVPHVNDEARRNALTVPRFRRQTPPTHVLLAPNGDVLRGRINAATENVVSFSSGLDELTIPMERVAAAIWLDKPKDPAAKEAPADEKIASDDLAATLATHWLVLQDGSRLGVNVDKFEADHIVAWAPALGSLKIPNAQLAVLKMSALPPSTAMVAYQGWQPEFAPEPVLPETGGQSSPLLGKPAPDFGLPLLGGGQFSLSAEKGKVVVLDFWATWCGPCVASLPEQIKTMAQFDPAKVKFVAVNQGEPEAQVSRFMAARGWQMTVAMDGQQDVGRKFGVEGIPHCVIIGPDGKVAWSHTGYTPGDSAKAAEAVKKLLGGG